ncbi:hypothetical protein KC19_VG016700 [Ceratodon purpureus]|uniref:Uncharacterized protein n=1 Tax=Ceratodon purpureus TaxID=3225 RepID=A0A8T0HL07_CERPU|nr:hypothetical protein KC19_VG016700 [Ceratodon purpureus]
MMTDEGALACLSTTLPLKLKHSSQCLVCVSTPRKELDSCDILSTICQLWVHLLASRLFDETFEVFEDAVDSAFDFETPTSLLHQGDLGFGSLPVPALSSCEAPSACAKPYSN